ncbi:PREDICTED: tumor necrosis factor receptor superfamily member 5 [Nanorana parkeri]|uniref:tumor necrosis factor receptor superfamily member 5 n=1 Tax=Nanorana parkeri TaxID=125878 RepID=UPI0008542E70|nr:PREDICTED: tumor necrosis factor receptor superfamily member 5 [Nanorana parkeri]
MAQPGQLSPYTTNYIWETMTSPGSLPSSGTSFLNLSGYFLLPYVHLQIEACSSTEQYEKYGKCCSLCRPGQRLHTECTERSETMCAICLNGEYQDKWSREKECLPHQYCDKNLGFQKISEGTQKQNVECVCQDGKHCSSTECETCVFNTLCAPGYGVTRKAEKYSDTECAVCPYGTFSNSTSDTEPCKDWQRCTSSQEESHPGSTNTDVACVKRRREKKVKLKQQIQDPPEEDNEDPLLDLDLPQPNLPEEDQDITMQGLPVAQEQGKDYHISQEEV